MVGKEETRKTVINKRDYFTFNKKGHIVPVGTEKIPEMEPEKIKPEKAIEDKEESVIQMLDRERRERMAANPSEAARSFLGYCLNEIIVDELTQYVDQFPAINVREYLAVMDAIKDRNIKRDPVFNLAYRAYTKEFPRLIDHIYIIAPTLEIYQQRAEMPRCTPEMLSEIIQRGIIDLFQSHKRVTMNVAKEKGLAVGRSFDPDLFFSLEIELLVEIFLAVDIEIERNKGIEKISKTPLNPNKGIFLADKEFKAFHDSTNPNYRYDPETNERSLIVTDVQSQKATIKEKVQYILSTQPHTVFEDLSIQETDLVFTDTTFQPNEFTSRVLCAISSILLQKNYYVSDYQIAQIVYGNQHPAQHQVEKIRTIHNQMINTWVKRSLVYKDQYDTKWQKWDQNCPLEITEAEKDTLSNRFPLLPVVDIFERKVRGQTTAFYHYVGLPKLVLLWIESGYIVNIPLSMLSSLFRSDRIDSQKVEIYFLATMLPMRRQRASKRNQPVFTYDTIIKSSGVSKNYTRAIDDLHMILIKAKEEKIKGVYDFFLDDVTRKAFVFKNEKEKERFLETHPEYDFIKSAEKHYKNRRLAL